MQKLKKNKNGFLPALAGIIGFFVICGVIGMAGTWTFNKIFGDSDDDDKTLSMVETDTTSEGRTVTDLADMGVECKWANKEVKKNINFMDKYSSSAIDPTTMYVFKEKPEDWKLPTGDFTDYYKAESSSSGVMVLQENPGMYYIVVKNTTAYNTKFLEIEVPCMGEDASVVLNEYNQAPDTKTVMLTQIATLSFTDVDFGVDETDNISTLFEVTKHDYTTVAEDQCVVLDGVMLKADATYDITADADSDGEYDEGVEYYKITIDNLAGVNSLVVFDEGKSIDLLEGDNEHYWKFDSSIEICDQDDLAVHHKIQSDKGTRTAAAADDEYLGNTEDVIDLVWKTVEGTTATQSSNG